MSTSTKTLYETDFAEWSDRTAALLRAGQYDRVDIENVAEEIESLGKSQRLELRSRVTRILEHLLKLSLTSGPVRDYNDRGWRASIRRQQAEIRQLLIDSPSLKRRLTPEMLQDSYSDATSSVAVEYDVKPPSQCPFAWSDVAPAAGAKHGPATKKKTS